MINIQRTLQLFAIITTTITGYAQGFLDWGNSFTGVFRAPIYGLEYYPDASGPITGQSALGVPAGNTIYHAPLLTGTGYTFAVYAGPASVVDSGSLSLLVSTTFRTSIGSALPRGLVIGGTVSVPGVPPGERVKFQIRAWNNLGGTLNFWPGGGFTPEQGATPMILSEPLGGIDSDGQIHLNAQTIGWSSFSFWIPEPSPTWLAGLAAVAFWLRRLRRKTGRG